VIQYRNGQFVLRQESYQTDTQIRSVSSSYLYVNDHPVDSEVTIEHGDLIRIGKTFEFRFE